MVSLNSDTQTGCTELTAKHSFLNTPDLMAKTISYLQVKDDKKSREALDALWDELDTLLPLLRLLPALHVEDDAYVLSGNVSQADWDRLQYYSRNVKFFIAIDSNTDDHRVHLSTYFRIAQLQSSESALFPSLRRFHYNLGNRSIPPSHIFLFLSPRLDSLTLHSIRDFESTVVGPFLENLATLSSQMLSKIVLHSGRMSGNILKKSIVHFKQLRSLELLDAVLLSDLALWEVLGTLSSLTNLTLKTASHPAHDGDDAENSNHQSGGPKYFDALESLCVTGSFFFIQHVLGFIDSLCLTTIKVYPVINHALENEPDNHFTPFITIIASKWSHSLKNLAIDFNSCDTAHRGYAISKCLMLLTVLHEMQTFHLIWKMKNMDDDVSRLVKSWPKLRTLRLPLSQTTISLSTLKTIAESCPELRHLTTRLDTSSFSKLDTSSNSSLRHNLEVLTVGRVHSSITQTNLACQIRVTQHLDLIFPYLKSIEVQPKDATWSGIRDLVYLCHDACLRRGNMI